MELPHRLDLRSRGVNRWQRADRYLVVDVPRAKQRWVVGTSPAAFQSLCRAPDTRCADLSEADHRAGTAWRGLSRCHLMSGWARVQSSAKRTPGPGGTRSDNPRARLRFSSSLSDDFSPHSLWPDLVCQSPACSRYRESDLNGNISISRMFGIRSAKVAEDGTVDAEGQVQLRGRGGPGPG